MSSIVTSLVRSTNHLSSGPELRTLPRDRLLDVDVEDIAVALVVTGVDGCIVAANAAGAAALGRPVDQLIGCALTSMLEATARSDRGDSACSVSEQLARIGQTLAEILDEFERVLGASEDTSKISIHLDRQLLARLSEREQLVVRRVLAGYRVPTIAAELFLSQSTVRNHLSSSFRKLGIHSQAELLERARANAAGRAAGNALDPAG